MGAATGSLEFIPAPGRDIDRTPIWIGQLHVSTAGAPTWDRIGTNDKYTWALTFDHLIPSEYLILKKYWDRRDPSYVPMPFRLLDPRDGGGTFSVVHAAPPTHSIQQKGYYAVSMSLREA